MNGALKGLYFLGILALTAIRTPHERQRRRTRIAVDRVTGVERFVLALLSAGMGVVPAIYTFTPWLNKADYRLPPRARGWAGGFGVVVLAIALWVFWRSHADLGRNWSPSLQIREGHTLVTGGVYRYVRHPMYATMWLWGIAQAALLQNWIAGWAGLALFVPMYVLRVPHEEQMMLEQFGDAYRVYMNRTGRVVPRFEGWGA